MNSRRLAKNLNSLVLAFVITAFLTAPMNVLAQNARTTQGVQKITSVEGITEYRLPNGLKVLLFPDQTKQTITVNITYLVGSRHENYGETGMAHLLEHLVFKGSPKYLKPDDEFAKRGARSNGSTTVDRTNYFETFPATDDNLNWALNFESDRMVNSFIAKKDLDSEMTVVRNEFENGENSPFRVLLDKIAAKQGWTQARQVSRAQDRELSSRLNSYLYLDRTLAWDTELERKVQALTPEQVNAAMRKYLTPDKFTIIKAGDFAKAKEKMKKQ